MKEGQQEESKEKKESEEEDDADFDRDEEDDEDANVEIEKEENKVKVKVNMTPGGIRKAEKEKEEYKKMDNFDLLDTLFSFIGGAKQEFDQEASRKFLNLGSKRSYASRATAGTTTALPGVNEVVRPRAQINFSEDEEELLPVSCGYFINIVRMLLMKQRKIMLRYLLLHSEGRAFDRLIRYIKYHSLSDLLMEMMQLTVAYQESPQ